MSDHKNEWPFPEMENLHPQSASIIINNYNYATFVGKAIDSALAQTHTAQVIVVDDGSTDGSRDVINSYGERIEAMFKNNGGQASAFNAGFARATGDIIFFLDSDDMMEPDSVETLLAIWRPETVLAHYPMTAVDSDGRPCGFFIPNPHAGLADGDVRNELLATGSFAATVTSGMAFARPALARIMPVPERDFSEAADGYLLRAVAFLGPLQRVETKLARYRYHDRNLSNPWSAPGGCAAGFRRNIRWSQKEFETTQKFAKMFQLPVSSDLGERDPNYLGYRLFSLLLDPANHPIADDHRAGLLRRYVVSRWRSSWSLRRRLMAIVLASLSALAKPSTAMTLILWMHEGNARPSWFRSVAAWLRRRQNA